MNCRVVLRKTRNAYIPFLVFLLILSGSSLCCAQSKADMQNPAYLASQGWDMLSSNDKDNVKKAEALFRKALDLDPYNAIANAGMGRVIYWKGHISGNKFDKNACRAAMKYYDKAYAADRNYDYIHFLKGDTYLCLEDYDNAMKEADSLRTPCIDHSLRTKAYLGMIKSNPKSSYKRSAITSAIDYLECSEEESGNTYYEFELLGNTLIVTKEYKSTAAYFEKNMQLKPHNKWSYFNYEWLLLFKTRQGHMDNNDVAEIKRIKKKAKETMNYDLEGLQQIHYHRAAIYNEKKQYDKALAEYTGSLAACPNYINVKDRISNLCQSLPRGRCIKSWQKIIKAYLDRGDCANAANEFNVQYSNDPKSFESLKAAVAKCKTKKQ